MMAKKLLTWLCTAGTCVVFAENVVLATTHNPSDGQKRAIAIAVVVFVILSHMCVLKWSVRVMVRSPHGPDDLLAA
jgi:hypothetical protein